MKKFAVKIINNRLVIDLDQLTDDYTESLVYDGQPCLYDVSETVSIEAFATIELTDSQVEMILAEYEGGGKCGWCDRVAKELSQPHLFDFVSGEKMYRGCWDMDRETYLGSTGVDIGEFEPAVKRGTV